MYGAYCCKDEQINLRIILPIFFKKQPVFFVFEWYIQIAMLEVNQLGGFLWKILRLSVTGCRRLSRSGQNVGQVVKFLKEAVSIAETPPEVSTHSLLTLLRGQVGSE